MAFYASVFERREGARALVQRACLRVDVSCSSACVSCETARISGPSVCSQGGTGGCTGTYQTLSGTSMSAPGVAGVAAVYLGHTPSIDLLALKHLVTGEGSCDVGFEKWSCSYAEGHFGRIVRIEAVKYGRNALIVHELER